MHMNSQKWHNDVRKKVMTKRSEFLHSLPTKIMEILAQTLLIPKFKVIMTH